MVAALWSNPNWDDTKESKGHRKNMIEGVNADFDETVKYVESSFKSHPPVEDDEKLEDNPFFAAAERGLAQVDEYIGEQKKHGKSVRIQKPEDTDYMKDVDQG
jgi:hypothetical protein